MFESNSCLSSLILSSPKSGSQPPSPEKLFLANEEEEDKDEVDELL
jgi:hypothetical protein